MILVFNPSCEMAVRADSMSYDPPRNVSTMERDLSTIVMLLGGKGDYVVAPKPDVQMISTWFESTDDAPKFINFAEAKRLIANGETPCPWGFSKATLNKMGLTERARDWHWRNLLSRLTSVKVEEALRATKTNDTFGFDAQPTLIKSADALPRPPFVLKSIWSSSGRGVRFFGPDDMTAAIDFAKKTIAADGAVVCERTLKRIAELSFLFDVKGKNVQYKGANVYHSGEHGEFGIEIAGEGALDIFHNSLQPDWQSAASKALSDAISQIIGDEGYEGPVGVDAMLYESPDGKARLRLCTEINVRHCMGHIGQAVARRLSAGTCAKWGMMHFSQDGEWDNYAAEQAETHPIVFDSQRRITKGFFRLTPLNPQARFAVCGIANQM